MTALHWLRIGIALIVTTAPALSHADTAAKVPEQIPGTTRVDAENLIALLERTPGLVIIDSRIEDDRAFGYLEGSHSLPDIATTCPSLARVVPNKSTPVLFYCNGVKCGRSVNAARVALGCGYKRVFWFRGGFEEWKAKNFPYLKH